MSEVPFSPLPEKMPQCPYKKTLKTPRTRHRETFAKPTPAVPPQPTSVPFAKVFEEERGRFGGGKGKLSGESFPFPLQASPFLFKDFHKRDGRRLRGRGGPNRIESFPETPFGIPMALTSSRQPTNLKQGTSDVLGTKGAGQPAQAECRTGTFRFEGVRGHHAPRTGGQGGGSPPCRRRHPICSRRSCPSTCGSASGTRNRRRGCPRRR